jgi:23S rRNA pseudouridine2605 synthase
VDGGLELVTSDGELAAQLQRRVRGLASGFSVRLRGELTEEQRAAVLGGELDSGARLTVESCEAGGGEGANRWYVLVARGASGKEVRQLFERQGALVSRVLRTHLGPLTLERSLGRGAFRELTAGELKSLAAPEPDTDSPAV